MGPKTVRLFLEVCFFFCYVGDPNRIHLFWCGVLVSLSVRMAFVGHCYTAKYRQKEGMHTYFSMVDRGTWEMGQS